MTEIWTGTAAVEGGSTTVTVVTGAALSSANCSPGALVLLGGVAYFVDDRIDTLSFELTRPYVGADGTVSLEISPVSEATTKLVNLATVVARTQSQLNVLDKNSQGLFFIRLGVTGNADPGPGALAFNQADPAAATEVYIDYLDANDAHHDVSPLLARFGVGTTIRLRALASAAFSEYDVSGTIIDEGGYFRLTLTYVGHSGVIGDAEPCALSWSKSGEGLTANAGGAFVGRSIYDAEPGGFTYLSNNGDGALLTGSVMFIKQSATVGDWSPGFPLTGPIGYRGWSPVLVSAMDGARRVLRLSDYVGGEGPKPTTGVGLYLGTGGLVAAIASATDYRGAAGLTAYEVAVATGYVGNQAAWVASLKGVPGTDGTDPGVYFIWSDSTADANPGSGVVRADTADLTLATRLYVSKSNKAGDDIAGFLTGMTLSNSVRKGTLTITRTGGNAQSVFDVLGATDATGYVKIDVENGVGATGFIANDAISFQFSPAGDRGTDGGGAGDFVGPSVSVQDNLVAFDGTGGKQGKDSGVKVSDLAKVANNLSDLGNKNIAHDNLMLKGGDVASGATLNLEAATGAFVNVTGTVATTAITLTSGHQRLVRAAAAWPITAGANLTLNNGMASYTCVPGDIILFVADGSVVRGTILTALTTFGRLDSAAVASAAETLAGTASKLISAASAEASAAWQALTDAATITINHSLGRRFTVTSTAARTISASNLKDGHPLIVVFTGNFAHTYSSSFFDFTEVGGVPPSVWAIYKVAGTVRNGKVRVYSVVGAAA